MQWSYHSESRVARFFRSSYRGGKKILLELPPVQFLIRYRFRQNLRLLNDVLATTELSGNYWLWGGVLLGWAREGRILPWDTDADFFYFSEDRNKFMGAIESLIQAGFKLEWRFVNNEGKITEYVFVKDHRKFEFFEVNKQEDTLHYFLYAPHIPNRLEMIGVVPWDGEVATMEFIGRTWLKPADHETFLTAIYGDWRTPNPDYDYVEDEKSIIAKHEWRGRVILGKFEY
ncbi:LicD-like protein [Candidatus Thiomargarita nelsonii]|uniref:LicD-like protein n=1 Tax=Candidatus Thiomargarita nelsonii TaxID=1003181 RepID=A0A176S4N9_9GAMM|nr:LicD-like protein [Candidatus Thiomargarita nelsonii]